jgi:hypothetical protein
LGLTPTKYRGRRRSHLENRDAWLRAALYEAANIILIKPPKAGGDLKGHGDAWVSEDMAVVLRPIIRCRPRSLEANREEIETRLPGGISPSFRVAGAVGLNQSLLAGSIEPTSHEHPSPSYIR